MRVLAIADEVSPFIYTGSFPNNLPPFDLVLSAGDMPGHVLEFIATRLTTTQPVYVLGNHHNEYLRRDDPETAQQVQLPGGCINAHGRVLEFNGVLIAGFEGSPRYRPGPHQYREWQMQLMTRKLTPQLLWNQ